MYGCIAERFSRWFVSHKSQASLKPEGWVMRVSFYLSFFKKWNSSIFLTQVLIGLVWGWIQRRITILPASACSPSIAAVHACTNEVHACVHESAYTVRTYLAMTLPYTVNLMESCLLQVHTCLVWLQYNCLFKIIKHICQMNWQEILKYWMSEINLTPIQEGEEEVKMKKLN